MFKVKLLAFLLAGMFVQTVYAAETGSALEQTQDCLKNKTCEAAKTEAGKVADKKALEAVAGNVSAQQELYNISAEIMPILVQQSGGDPAKMQALMQKAQTDPEAFYKSLPADIQAKIKATASAVEKAKAK